MGTQKLSALKRMYWQDVYVESLEDRGVAAIPVKQKNNLK